MPHCDLSILLNAREGLANVSKCIVQFTHLVEDIAFSSWKSGTPWLNQVSFTFLANGYIFLTSSANLNDLWWSLNKQQILADFLMVLKINYSLKLLSVMYRFSFTTGLVHLLVVDNILTEKGYLVAKCLFNSLMKRVWPSKCYQTAMAVKSATLCRSAE